MKKFKIIIETDSDISEESTKPYFKDSGFEELSSDYLLPDVAYPLLLSAMLLTRFLPKYYGYYYIGEINNFSERLYNKNLGEFKLPAKEEIKKYILENYVLGTLVLKDMITGNNSKEESLEKLADLVFDYIQRINSFIKSNSDERIFYMGNQNIKIVKDGLLSNLTREEKAIVEVLEKEFGSEFKYREYIDLANKIIRKLKEENLLKKQKFIKYNKYFKYNKNKNNKNHKKIKKKDI